MLGHSHSEAILPHVRVELAAHHFLSVACFPLSRHHTEPVLSLAAPQTGMRGPPWALSHYSSRQSPRRDSAGAPRRGPGWSEGRALDRARPCGPRPCLAPPRVYAAPRRPWDPGSSECPPQLCSPASGPRESEKGTDFPALSRLRVRPRGRDPGRARGPPVGRGGEGEAGGESAACPAGRGTGRTGRASPAPGGTPAGPSGPAPGEGESRPCLPPGPVLLPPSGPGGDGSAVLSVQA